MAPKGTQESGSEDCENSSNEDTGSEMVDNIKLVDGFKTVDGVKMVNSGGDKDIEEVMKFRLTLTRGVDDNGKDITYFKCALCEKESNDRSNMRRHMITQHTKPINQPCPFKKCGKIFKSKWCLQKHISTKQCLQIKDESD